MRTIFITYSGFEKKQWYNEFSIVAACGRMEMIRQGL